MDDGPAEETNFEGLMEEGEGHTPGELPAGLREREVLASTPLREGPARVAQVDLINDVSRNEQQHFNVGNVEKVLISMATMQAETNSQNADNLQKAADCINDLSAALMEKTRSEKRGREDGVEDRLRADSPVTINFKELVMKDGLDNAHTKICWEVRRCWRAINMDPEEYWKDDGEGKGWPRKVEPNLAGQVFLDHLLPHMVSDKALQWLHDVSKPLEVRYFLHSNNRTKSKKNKRMEIQAREPEGGEGGMHIDTFVTWNEAGTVKEMVEAVLNYLASIFMIRPWDYSGLVILRCLHDVSFFALTSRTAREQKDLVSEFVEEVFLVNARQMAKGRHPMTLKEAMELAGRKVSGKNGMTNLLTTQCDVYGMHREIREKEDEVKKLKAEVSKLKSQLNDEKMKKKGGGYDDFVKRRDGRPVEDGSRRGMGDGRYPAAFVEARKKTCLFFNKGDCRQGSACTRGDHSCSQQVGQRMCGSEDHARPGHK